METRVSHPSRGENRPAGSSNIIVANHEVNRQPCENTEDMPVDHGALACRGFESEHPTIVGLNLPTMFKQ
ncbi:MAG: hypothetical protein FGF50_02945 [Candidatus Brockarchaeota archaeon]|nr:hypothetical protein [Candidatus Brockarchaeota archaeon]